MKILEEKFNDEILENKKYISELKLSESKYQNNSELHNLKLENIKLNIDLVLQNEKCLTEIYANKKKVVITNSILKIQTYQILLLKVGKVRYNQIKLDSL